MGDDRTDLPEGTDTIIAGATNTDDTVIGRRRHNGDSLVTETKTPAPRATARSVRTAACGSAFAKAENAFPTEAGDRARGFVSQGLERSAEALPTSASSSATRPPASMRAWRRIWRLRPPRRLGDREHRQQHRLEKSGRTDRGHPQFRPQQPGHCSCRRGDRRLRARPAAQDRPPEPRRRRRSLSADQPGLRAEAAERA